IAPGCNLPGLSSLSICAPGPFSSPNRYTPLTGYPRAFERKLENIDGDVGGFYGAANIALSVEIKLAEIAIRDLVSIVEISDLEVKDALILLLSEFITAAQKASIHLQKYSLQVREAVNNIMASNVFFLNSIKAARVQEPLYMAHTALPWRSAKKSTEFILSKSFQEVTNVLAVDLERLVLKTDVSLYYLQDLEGRLNTLHTLLLRKQVLITNNKHNTLAALWTQIGGNVWKLCTYNRDLLLLENLSDLCKQALAHIVIASQLTQRISKDMEVLKYGIMVPNLLGLDILAGVHAKKIEMGLQRL
ncbi:hypothetical protein CPB83DRAFT_742527, partial [Crepidotus variabilis]